MKVVESISELGNIWYHGTTSLDVPSIRAGITLEACNELVDFGRGFYLTSNPKQAWKWAVTRSDANHRQRNFLLRLSAKDGIKRRIPRISRPAVIQFEVDLELLERLNGKIFKKEDDEWALFILGNRIEKDSLLSNFNNKDAKFDYVYGPLADGWDIGLAVEEVEKKGMLEEFLEDIRGKYHNFPIENQLSVHTKVAIDCLNFKEVFHNEPKRLFSRK